jgi:hypothetical protein
MPTTHNLTLWAGDGLTLSAVALDAAGAVISLTGATLDWRLTNSTQDLVLGSIGTRLAVVSAAAGTFTLTLDADDTANLDGGTYRHAGTVTTAAGIVTTVIEGRVRIIRDTWSSGAVITPVSGTWGDSTGTWGTL